MDSPEQGMSAARALTIEQAAAALGVSLMTVRRRVREGALPAERVRGKFGPEWRVYLEAPAVLSADHPMPRTDHIDPKTSV
ncbi:MAG TPA: helix-turn-helix domain-containing protein [Actinomycetota bacterium]|nr:helix-turn-helix domain-containing protein [Actinomycetota bacterium]